MLRYVAQAGQVPVVHRLLHVREVERLELAEVRHRLRAVHAMLRSIASETSGPIASRTARMRSTSRWNGRSPARTLR